jgi:uncharacterized protein
MSTGTKRFYVVDALRGFAIVSIMLLHNIEHFDFYFNPPNIPGWLATIDKGIWDTLFFLFGGKSYAMFAFLFGLTFYIQMNNQEKRGNDFRPRFAWRLILLLVFGIINSAFYQGDILSLYAAVGFLLIPVAKLRDRTVFIIATVLFLQPFELGKLIISIINPDVSVSNPESWTYFGKMKEYIPRDSFINTIMGNLVNGKTAVVLWSWENGRFFHMLSLFMFGMLAGRRKVFEWNEKNKKLWTKTLIIASICFIPLYLIKNNTDALLQNNGIRHSFSIMETSWTNICFMLVLLSGFVLLFHSKYFHKPLNAFSSLGKMSLSNYIFQSLIGSSIYYGFGLGLYRYANTTLSLLIGITLAIIMGLLCTWWAKRFKRGPLETIWHRATWIEIKRPVPEVEEAKI